MVGGIYNIVWGGGCGKGLRMGFRKYIFLIKSKSDGAVRVERVEISRRWNGVIRGRRFEGCGKSVQLIILCMIEIFT